MLQIQQKTHLLTRTRPVRTSLEVLNRLISCSSKRGEIPLPAASLHLPVLPIGCLVAYLDLLLSLPLFLHSHWSTDQSLWFFPFINSAFTLQLLISSLELTLSTSFSVSSLGKSCLKNSDKQGWPPIGCSVLLGKQGVCVRQPVCSVVSLAPV